MSPGAPRQVGRYVVIEPLGQGGMGVVYRAWDPELRRTVALKMIADPAGLPLSAELLERFTREARSVAALTHPHIVTIYDFGTQKGRPYLAMECLDGESMAQLLAARRPLSLDEKFELAIALCDAIAFAHDRGVIHRDIKPGNLIVTSEGTLKVLDFGLARVVDESTVDRLTVGGRMLGTLGYMAPEQVQGERADERSDVFAIGAVLYELFTYRLAFDGEDPARLIDAIVHDEPLPMHEVAPQLPPALSAIVAHAMRKTPADRCQSVDQLRAALRQVARGIDVPLTPPADELDAAPRIATAALNDVVRGWQAFVNEARALPAVPAEPPVSLESSSPPAPVTPASIPSPGAQDRRRMTATAPARRGRTLEYLAIGAAILAVIVYLVVAGGTTSPPAATPPPASVSAPPVSGTAPAGGRASGPENPTAPGADRGNGTLSGRDARGGDRTPPAPVKPAGSRPLSPRCLALLERAGLGETLPPADQEFLRTQCGSGGK